MSERRRTLVVGGGVVGLAVAHALATRGEAVTLLERTRELASGCSAGNAGIVGARWVEPLATPHALAEGMRALRRRDSPFAIRRRPSSAAWIARFAFAAARSRDGRAHAQLQALARESFAMHLELHERLDTGLAQHGFLSVYRDPAALAARRAANDGATLLDAAALRAAHPQLGGALAGAALDPHEAHLDPARFAAALAHDARRAGADLRTGVEVLELRRRGARVERVLTTHGELTADAVVVAAGAWSRALLAPLGLRLPVLGGKGYHVELPAAPGDPALPLYLPDRRVVVTPLPGRVRVSGTLELAGTDERVRMRRVRGVLDAALELLPDLRERPLLHVWRGLRPCSPDGLPIVARTPDPSNLVLATGHGMWGLQLAPVTGRLVADLLAQRL